MQPHPSEARDRSEKPSNKFAQRDEALLAWNLACQITAARRSKVHDLNLWSTIAFENSSNFSRELLIISLDNASPRPPTRVPLLIGKGAIDDDVFDADVRRGGRNLPKTVLSLHVHGIDDHIAAGFENPRAARSDTVKDASLAAWSFTVGIRLFPDFV
jgi:hypothetical protein